MAPGYSAGEHGAGLIIAGVLLGDIPDPTKAPIEWDMPYWRDKATFGPPAHSRGLNSLYVDGHVKWIPFMISKQTGSTGDDDYWVVHSWEGWQKPLK